MACERRLEELWGWRSHVAGLLARRAPTSEHVADALAGAYAVAWQRLPAIPEDDDAARAWLYLTAWRVLANLRRREAHQVTVVEALWEDPRRPSSGAVGEDRMVLVDAYRALGAPDRRVLAFVATHSVTLAELAVALGCTPTAAGARLSRARRRLEDAIRA